MYSNDSWSTMSFQNMKTQNDAKSNLNVAARQIESCKSSFHLWTMKDAQNSKKNLCEIKYFKRQKSNQVEKSS